MRIGFKKFLPSVNAIRKAFFGFAAFGFLLVPSGGNVLAVALNQSELNSIYADTVWYRPTGNVTCAGAGSSGGQVGGLVWPFSNKEPNLFNRIDQGWDIQSSTPGAAVYAISAGTITKSNPDPVGGFGNDYPTEQLDASIGGPTNFVYYGHVHVLVGVIGQKVQAGQQIAVANTTDPENGSKAPAGWLEIGFATSGAGIPAESGTAESAATQAGQQMKTLLENAQPGSSSGSSGTTTSCGSTNSCLSVALPTVNDPQALGDAINAFLDKHAPGGKLNGLGQQIVEGAIRQGVNPILVVGVAGSESTWTKGAPPDALAANNAFGNLLSGPGSGFYKWASWLLSVDDPNGKDEPSLLKSTYLSDPGVVDFLTFAAKYIWGNPTHIQAGPAGDPVAYSNNLTQWANEIIGAAGSAITCVTGSGAAPGSVASIWQTALNLAWPEPGAAAKPPRDPLLPKPEYTQALQKYNPAGLGLSGGADCGVFVATVMRASGADPNYPVSGSDAQKTYVLNSPKYVTIQLDSSYTTYQYQPGDILIVPGTASITGHTLIYVGPQANGYNEASASQGTRMPNLYSISGVTDPQGRGYYLVARLK